MSLKQKLEDLVDKLTTGEQMQYILAGTLILIIIISLLSVFLNLGGSNSPNHPSEMHFYCLETGKEFIFKPGEQKDSHGMMEPEMMGPGGMRVISPYTNERTAVPMTRCPNCEKWFVPEYYLSEEYQDNPMMMGPQGELVCPHCGTNIIKWYREKRKKRK